VASIRSTALGSSGAEERAPSRRFVF